MSTHRRPPTGRGPRRAEAKPLRRRVDARNGPRSGEARVIPLHDRPASKPAGRRAATRHVANPPKRHVEQRTERARPLQRRVITGPRPPRFRFRAGQAQRRVKLIFAISLVLLTAVLGRVVWLQITQASTLEAAGKKQRTTERLLKAQRGTIFAADGSELALSVPSSTVVANPKLILDIPGTVSALTSMLQLSPEKAASLETAFNAKQTSFVYVARQIDTDLAKAVDGLRLPGVDIMSEEHRTMPAGDVAKSVVGRTDIDGVGITGLEQKFNPMLTGVDGDRVYERDVRGRSIAGSGAVTKAPIAGEDIVLTIDRSLQYQVEQALLARVEELKARGGTVVVMSTKTGDIAAMASVRRNDQGVTEVTWSNIAAVEAQEPGSVAKVFSIAAAIDAGVITADTYFNVPGLYTFDKGTKWERTIRDAEPHGPVDYSVRQIMTKSSNIGTLLAAGRLTPEQLHAYHQAFGFGQATGLDLPYEAKGILRPGAELKGSEAATVSYGYGFATSSLQLVAAVNTIANGGTYVAPRLINATIDRAGQRSAAPAAATHPVVKPETAAEMTSIMTDVVCRGTAKNARMDGIVSVAGKTGTAYKLQANKTYQADDGGRAYFASFVGFLPAQNPQVTILVSIDEPDSSSGDRFGGTASAPLFVTVAKDAMHELQVTPVEGDTGCPGR